MKRLLLLCVMLTLASCVTARTQGAKNAGSDLARKIAGAYGFKRWDRVKELNFTFNVQRPDQAEPASRKWTWYPRENTVTLHRAGEPPLTYPREIFEYGEPVQVTIDADKQFVNDSYWFLFPFQLVWSNPVLTDHGMQSLPIGEGTARKVTAQWPQEGGYTPGDAYDLYLDKSHRIVQWVFRRGGGEKGGPVTWEGNMKIGPIVAATEHWGPDRKFHLWFTDISMKVGKDEDAVTVEPQSLEEGK